MSNDNLDKVKELLGSAFTYAKQNDFPSPIDLAQLGGLIRFYDSGFAPQQYGYEKLRPLLEQMPDVIEVIKDDTISPPRFFANYLGSDSINTQQVGTAATTPAIPAKRRDNVPRKLLEFAVIIKAKWEELAALALEEYWGGDNLPLLRNYIQYTFSRLTYENKIIVANDRGMAVFNTGLVDRRYQPIYALLVKNNGPRMAPWFLDSFCVAGELRGKALVRTFNPLPDAAYYFENPVDAIFNIKAHVYTDWKHVIEDNSNRIPPELLSRTTRGFDVKSCDDMNTEEIEEYKNKLVDYLANDDFAYRSLIDAFNRALELALKKVRWNYKTAIPVYFPANNSLSMLLPLSLLSDDQVDLALVAERTASGNYQGHTIYPLSWAYSNSRLIARPDSDWLRAEATADLPNDDPEEQS